MDDVGRFQLLNRKEKSKIIQEQSKLIPPPSDLPSEKIVTYQMSKYLDTFLREYFQIQISDQISEFSNIESRKTMIQDRFNSFLPSVLQTIETQLASFLSRTSEPKNIYELSTAYNLAFGNNVTRTLSTVLGLFWENLVDLSPYAINPENEFSIKLVGVDAIIFYPNKDCWYYTQIKTQQNTLTGSQTKRSESELSIFENKQFAACFGISSWTFNSKIINRLSGKEFWEPLGFNYDEIVIELKNFMKKVDLHYLDQLNRASKR